MKTWKEEMNITIKANIEDTGRFKLSWQDLMNPPENPPLQKLTQEVFEMFACPTSSTIAVVNDDGQLYFGTYEDAKQSPFGGGKWRGIGDGAWLKMDGIYFDASDWPNGCKVIREKK